MTRTTRAGTLPAARVPSTLALAVILLGVSLLTGTAAQLPTEPGPDWRQTRLQYGLRPAIPDVPHFDVGGIPFPGSPGIYVNAHPTHVNGSGAPLPTLRVYGEAGEGAPWPTYTQLNDSHDPTVIPKDSVTFNAAMIAHDDPDFTGNDIEMSWLRGCGGWDANLKAHLRTWYAPAHEYDGARAQAGFWQPPTRADALQVESTYNLVTGDTHQPVPMCSGESRIPFPTDGTEGALHPPLDLTFDSDDTSSWAQPGLDTMRQVRIRSLTVGPSAPEGTVELERSHLPMKTGTAVQMFDHIYRYEGSQKDFNGNDRAMFTVWYAGNTVPDSATTILLGGDNPKQYLSRANNMFATAAHPWENPTGPRTSYLEIVAFNATTVTVHLGKEIRGGDTFYVDGVRYDVPSVLVTHNDATDQDELHLITLRTPIPKSDPHHGDDSGAAWSSVDNAQIADRKREVYAGGQWQVDDWSFVSTQRLVQVDHDEPIPVGPPFNHETYRQIDDTDVILWKAGAAPLADCAPVGLDPTFPWGRGAALGAVPATNGLPRFPLGHTYVTMVDPPGAWIDCFDAEPTGYAQLGNRDAPITEPGINHAAWSPGVPAIPAQAPDPLVDLYWVAEWCEGRFHSNLQEVLFETDPANVHATWTAYGIASHPCRYTELVLPDRSNPYSNLTGRYLDSNKSDATAPTPASGHLKQIGFGDYLVMTSYRLQDGDTRFAFTHKAAPSDPDHDLDLATATVLDPFLSAHGFGGDTLETARLYGGSGLGAIDYTEYWHAFDPYAIQADSVVFNPAIILHTDPDFTGNDATFGWLKACDESNSNLKKHLRMWYEPNHTFDGPRVPVAYDPPTRADVLQIESTYLLVDSGDFTPRTMCPQTDLPFPTEGHQAFVPATGQPLHVSGDAQPGLNKMTQVTVGGVRGSGTNGTIELTRKAVTLKVNETIQMFDHLYRFDGIEETFANGSKTAKFTAWYLGNPVADSKTLIEVGSERVYLSRANNKFTTPSHGDAGPVRTSFLDLTNASFTAPGEENASVTFLVGKELTKGDTFYVTGVRYDIPAIAVKEDPHAGMLGAQTITLRNPIPKGDPNYGDGTEAAWTSVPDALAPTRVRYDGAGAKEWVIDDFSWASSQSIRQCDGEPLRSQTFTFGPVASVCPIWVDPPFNHESYRMVDDTDVRLWQAGPDRGTGCASNWPWGVANAAVPGGNGLPRFPLGHTYLTAGDPPQAWRDCFDAQPTGFDALANRVDQNAAPGQPGHDEPGYSHQRWSFSGVGPDAFPLEHVGPDGTSINWVKEWCEDRSATNLLQVPQESGDTVVLGALEVASSPCQYTELVLPDRTNPHSVDGGELQTGKDDLVPAERYTLLGADYLVTSTLYLQDAFAWGPFDTYDGNEDCVVTQEELMAGVLDWFDGIVTIQELGRTIYNWKNSDETPHTHYPGCTHP